MTRHGGAVARKPPAASVGTTLNAGGRQRTPPCVERDDRFFRLRVCSSTAAVGANGWTCMATSCRCRLTSNARPRQLTTCQPLPDRICARTRGGRCAHGRAAFRRRHARGAARSGAIDIAYVTLHVGAGTFQPVVVDDLAQHRMHRELRMRSRLPTAAAMRRRARRADGACWPSAPRRCARSRLRTTATATARVGSVTPTFSSRPGYRVWRRRSDCSPTFHLPRSTLMMLVSAFAGYERIRARRRARHRNAPPLLQSRWRRDAAGSHGERGGIGTARQ